MGMRDDGDSGDIENRRIHDGPVRVLGSTSNGRIKIQRSGLGTTPGTYADKKWFLGHLNQSWYVRDPLKRELEDYFVSHGGDKTVAENLELKRIYDETDPCEGLKLKIFSCIYEPGIVSLLVLGTDRLNDYAHLVRTSDGRFIPLSVDKLAKELREMRNEERIKEHGEEAGYKEFCDDCGDPFYPGELVLVCGERGVEEEIHVDCAKKKQDMRLVGLGAYLPPIYRCIDDRDMPTGTRNRFLKAITVMRAYNKAKKASALDASLELARRVVLEVLYGDKG